MVIINEILARLYFDNFDAKTPIHLHTFTSAKLSQMYVCTPISRDCLVCVILILKKEQIGNVTTKITCIFRGTIGFIFRGNF